MTKDTDTRHADMFGDEQHDGQNENDGEQYVTDSARDDTTDCDRCSRLHDCLFDDSFELTSHSCGIIPNDHKHDPLDNQLTLFNLDSEADDGSADEAYTDYTGRVYTEADVNKAQYEKYPIVRAWLTQNPNVFRWLETAFMELADVATGPEISGNVLAYHLRYNGIADAEGRRQRRNVAMSNNINPALARVLGILHPDEADKLRMHPCVWDVPALQPQLEELAKVIDEER